MVDLVRPNSGEVQVDPVPSGYTFPTLTNLPTGNLVAIWANGFAATDGNGIGIEGTLLSPDGHRIGAIFPVNTTTAGDQFAPHVAVLASGDFIVSWFSFGDSETGGFAQRFKNDGSKIGGEISLGPIPYNDGENSAPIVGLKAGGFVSTSGDAGDLLISVFDTNGALVNRATVDSGAFDGTPNVVALSGGGFALLWQTQSDVAPLGIKAQLFDASGHAHGALVQVDSSGFGNGVTAAPLADGGYVAAWRDFSSSGGILAQRFDAAGAKVGSEIHASTHAPGYETNETVVAFDWGGFLIAWQDDSPGVIGDPGLRAQLFDSDGAKIGDEFNLNVQNHDEGAPTLTVVSDSEFIASWVDQGPSGDVTGLLQRHFTLPQLGTAGNDTLVGTAGDDGIAGRVGDDTIQGMGGNDIIDGGSGNDTMIGGNGDDSYVVDSAQDKVVETAGAGTDSVFASVSYTLPDNVERLTITGSAANATGNAIANTIIGDAGDNVIDGKAGADTMTGGKGNDTYLVNDPADHVIEAMDEGTDLIVSTISFTLPDNVENLTLSGAGAVDGSGNDLANLITGTAGDNTLLGSFGSDTFVGGGGNDTLDGGVKDFDVAVFDKAHTAYTVTAINPGHQSVAGQDGTDQLNDIEILRFADGNYAWDETFGTLISLDDAQAGFRLYAPDKFAGQIGGVGVVVGTAGYQDISILDIPGTIIFDPSFNRGGDDIRLSGLIESWQAARSGSSAVLTNGHTTVVIPVGTEGTSVDFLGALSFKLVYDTTIGTVTLGGQVLTPSPITVGGTPGVGSFNPIDPAATGQLFLQDNDSAPINGRFNMVGTLAKQHVTVVEGSVTLDPSFNRGGDTLTIYGNASNYTAERVGSSVEVKGAGDDILVPVGTAGIAMHFSDGDHMLIYDSKVQSILFDTQVIGATPVALHDFA